MSETDIWDDLVGDAWVRYAAVIDSHSRVFGEAAMDRLGSVTDARVLDVGCGTGTTTAALVGRGAADVVGIDLSARMLAEARSSVASEHATFRRGDVLELAGTEPFDAVFSRFGVMFFDDAVAGFAHLRALVRPGGRLAFSAWKGPFENPWMVTPVLASIPVIGPPALPGPGEPGPFSLGEPDHVAEVLAAAGWVDVVIEPLAVEQAHPSGDPESVARQMIACSPPLAMGVAADPSKAEALEAAIIEVLEPLVRDGSVVLGAAALIVGAQRPDD